MTPLRLEVLTPQGKVFDEFVDAVIAPLTDGWIGVLPGHAPFRARVLPGEIAVRAGGQRHIIATLGGVFRAEADLISVLTSGAALDTDRSRLEQDIGQRVARAHAMEQEAQKHFGRVYRTLADTLDGRRRRM